MSSCCPLCSSANQLAVDSASICMDCGTVAVSGFTFPVGLMLVGVAVTAGAWMAIRKLRSKVSVMSRVQPA